jgi:mycothiol synthase
VTVPPLTKVASADFPAIIETVKSIEAATHAASGHDVLGEAVWRDLQRPADDSAAFLVDGHAVAHVARSDNVAPRHWAVGVALAPAMADHVTLLRLLQAVDDHVAAHGGGRVVLWVIGAPPEDDEALTAAGFVADRELYEMRVALPLDEAPTWPDGVTVRTFQPGRDDQPWVEVNNRAFAGHAEQGGWTEATLQRRFADAWFDPTLFLLAFDEQGLAGFNWLKIHDADRAGRRLGEIFVIGVDPRMQGTGLGRVLALAGLDLVHQRGIDTGMLFCAADNAPALKLYRSLGFTVHRVDRAYERDVQAREAAS